MEYNTPSITTESNTTTLSYTTNTTIVLETTSSTNSGLKAATDFFPCEDLTEIQDCPWDLKHVVIFFSAVLKCEKKLQPTIRSCQMAIVELKIAQLRGGSSRAVNQVYLRLQGRSFDSARS